MFLIHSIDKGIFLVLGWVHHRHQISLLVLIISHFPHPRACSPKVPRSSLQSGSVGISSIHLLECSTTIVLSGESSDILVSQLRSETCSLTLAAELCPFFQSFALAFLLVFYDLAQLLCLIL
jgi:hypothetical protein